MAYDGHWILPVPVELLEWAEWFEDFTNRRMALTEFNNGASVSTVFLGIDHGFGDGQDPVLFETLIRGGEFDQDINRYATFDVAITAHKTWVTRIIQEAGESAKVTEEFIKERPPKPPRKLEYSNETNVSILREKIVRKVVK